MARYDYHCPDCGITFEVEHPMSAHPKVSCPSCGGAPAPEKCESCGACD